MRRFGYSTAHARHSSCPSTQVAFPLTTRVLAPTPRILRRKGSQAEDKDSKKGFWFSLAAERAYTLAKRQQHFPASQGGSGAAHLQLRLRYELGWH